MLLFESYFVFVVYLCFTFMLKIAHNCLKLHVKFLLPEEMIVYLCFEYFAFCYCCFS